MSAFASCTEPSNFSCKFLMENWKKRHCSQELRYARVLGSLPNSTTYSKKNIEPYMNKFGAFLDKYFLAFPLTDDTGSSRYCPLQEELMHICRDQSTAPFCVEYLDTLCKDRTRDKVSQSRTLSSMCGCRVSADPMYLKYTKKSQCDPMCNNVMVAQNIDIDTGQAISCTSNVCVINDVNLSKVASASTVSVNQICGHCGKDGCTCIIAGVSLPELMKRSDLNHVFTQYCSGHSVCVQRSMNGGVDTVTDCKDALDEAKKLAEERYLAAPVWYLITIGVLLLSVTIVMFAFVKLGMVH